MNAVGQNVTLNRTFADKIVGSFGTVPAGPLIGPTPLVHLLSGVLSITPQTLLADLTAAESTFAGYAAATPQTEIGTSALAKNVRGIVWTAMFSAATQPGGASVTGYYLTGSTPLDWIVAEVFNQPVALGPNGDALVLTVFVPVSMFVVIV